MKKYIISLVLIFTLSSPLVATAFLPLLFPSVIAALAIHSIAMSTSLLYSMTSSGSSSISPSGTISRPSQVQWIDLTLPTPAVVTKPITAQMPFFQLKTLANNGGDKYLGVKAALFGPPPPLSPLSSNSEIGSKYQNNTSNPTGPCIVTDKINSMTSNGSINTFSWHEASFVGANDSAVCTNGYPGCKTVTIIRFTETTFSNEPYERSPLQFSKELLVDPFGSEGPVRSIYQSELDKMFQDPAYVPTFTDDTTGLPFSPPLNAATPAQVDAYNKQGAAGEATAADLAARTAASGVAAKGATAAGTAYDAARAASIAADGAAAGAGGTDAGLNAAALAARIAAGAAGTAAGVADTAAAKAAADLAALDAANKTNAAITAPESGPSYGDGSTHDFGARFGTFMSDMKTSSLFSLPAQFLGNIPSGGQSVFNLDFGRFGQTTFDLASFGSAITLLRTLVLCIFSVTAFKIVTLKGGSG